MFFGLLSLGLLLGDGKQSVVDVFGISIVFVCWFYYGSVQSLPMRLLLPWIVFGAVSILSAWHSVGIGYSVSWLARLSCGFLIYRLFYGLADQKTTRAFIVGATLFVTVAVSLSALSFLWPVAHAILPSMNLIDRRYGHNHLADLLVFVAPLMASVFAYIPKRKRVVPVIVLGYIFFLVSTVARGAWLIIGGYLGVQAVLQKSNVRIQKYALGALVIVLFVGVGYQLGKTYTPLSTVAVAEKWRQAVVRPLSFESRKEYWRQAIEAVKERPILGSGPGTFSLDSTRLQNSALQSSWFAHSIVLQFAAEVGLVGLVAFLWLIGVHFFYFFRLIFSSSDNQEIRSVAWGVLLLFLYGLFDFVLDYHVTWLLFWAGIGLVSGVGSHGKKQVETRFFPPTPLFVFIGAFYVSWVLSSIVALTTHRYDIAYRISPFDAPSALIMLENNDRLKIQNTDIQLALFFHKKNPQILEAASRAVKQKDPERAIEFLRQATQNNPQNMKYATEYLRMILTRNDKRIVANEMTKLFLYEFDFNRLELLPYLNENLLMSINNDEKKGEYMAKLYYQLGRYVLSVNHNITKTLWILARNNAPQWGDFHVELAGLYDQFYSDNTKAKQILMECMFYDSPKKQCRAALRDGIAPVGSLLETIQTIPR